MQTRHKFHGNAGKGSVLYGFNYGAYPIHRFRHAPIPDPVYPVYVSYCGHDEWHRQCLRNRTNSSVFAIEYVLDGVFLFSSNGKNYRCQKGDVFLVHYGADTSMQCETETAVKFVLQLTGPSLPNILSVTGLDTIAFIRPADRSKIEFYYNNIHELLDGESIHNSGELCRNCFSMLVELAEQSLLTTRPEPLQRAINFIRQHIRENLQLGELAAYSGVSQATLHRLFVKYLKVSPINYFLKVKMDEATRLINQHHRIKEVASMLNYSSAQYFSNEFKKHFGISPRNYLSPPPGCRKEQQKKKQETDHV